MILKLFVDSFWNENEAKGLFGVLENSIANFSESSEKGFKRVSLVSKDFFTTLKGGLPVITSLRLALGGIAVVAGVVISKIAKKRQEIKDMIQATDEAASSYSESSKSMDEYIKRYEELQQALKDAKGNEEETYSVKQQLLELQTELNDVYGTEFEKVNLVTDAYRDQTDVIKGLHKAKEWQFLYDPDNERAFKDAKKAMETEKTYTIGYVDSEPEEEYQQKLKALYEKYADKGVYFDTKGAGVGEYTVQIHTDPTNAKNVMESISKDLNELNLQYKHLFGVDDINPFEFNSKEMMASIKEVDAIISEFGNRYQNMLFAEIGVDKAMSDQWDTAEKAIADYNEAVLNSEDPFTDEDVATARQKVEEMKQAMSEGDWGKYGYLVEDLFAGADTALYDFTQKLSNTSYLQNVIDAFKEYDEVSLRAMANDGTRDAFDIMLEYASQYGLEIEDVIYALKQLGYMQGQVFSSDTATPKLSFVEVQSNIQSLSKGLEQVDAIYADILNKEDFDYSSILNNTDFTTEFGKLSGASEEYKNVYNDFIETVSNSPDDINACQNAFDRLVTAYIQNSEALKGVTEESKNAAIAQLEQMGIANAEEMVMAELGLAIENYEEVKKQAAAKGIDLANATWEEIDALVTEGIVAGESATALFYYQFQKALSNDNPINTIEDCNQLYALAVRCGATSEVLEDLIRLRQIYETLADSSFGLSQYDMNDLLAQANALQSSIKKQVEGFESSYEPVARYTGGLKSAEEASKGAKDATDALKEAIQQEIDALEKQKEALQDSLNELDELYDAIQWFLDGQIEDFDDIIEKIQEENDALAEQREIYDNILSVVDSVYNAEIEAIQEKIDALEKENDEKEKAIALEKARQKVEEMRNNKSILQYTADQGYIYTVDESGLKEAEDEYADLAQELEESKIKKELEDQKELLQQNLELWEEIPNAYEKAMNEMAAMQYFGADWKNAILNSDEGTIGKFQDNYTGLQENEKANEDKISYYEEEKKKIEDLKELWEDAKNAYRDSQYEAKLASFFGSDYEHQILNNSLTWRTQFTNEYCSLQMQIADIEEKIKALNEQSANIIADSATKVSTALNQTTDAVNGLKSSLSAEGSGGSNLLSGVEGSVDKTLLQIESLRKALSDLDLARKALEETIDADVVDTSKLVGETQAKVQEINVAISSLLLSIRLLRINIEELLNALLNINDTVTLDRVITLIGSGESGSLLGAINSVVDKLSDSNGGLLYELNELNGKQLDFIIAEFNGDESLLSAIREVSSAILSAGDQECLVAKINSLTETIGSIDSVKESFSLLNEQVNSCVLKVETLNDKIQGLQDKTITITVETVVGSTDIINGSLPDGIEIDNASMDDIFATMPYGRYAKGGIVGKKDESILDFYAESLGEDHMVAVQDEEAIIPVNTVKSNPELVNALLNADGKSISLSDKGISYKVAGNSFNRNGNTFTPVNVPNLFGSAISGFNLDKVAPKYENKMNPESYMNTVSNENSISISIGDIHLSGVQDVNGLSNAIINKLPNTLIQALGRI